MSTTAQASGLPRLQLIGFPQGNFTRALRMLCEEKQIAYDLDPVWPHTPAAFAHHPLGRVPSMRHGELRLFESRAIAMYIEATFPEPPLIPTEPVAAAQVEQWVALVNTAIDQTLLREYVLSYVTPQGTVDGQPDRAAIDRCLPRLHQQVRMLDEALTGSSYLVGGRFSYADIVLMPILDSVRAYPEGRDAIHAAPALTAYYELHAQRPSFVKARPAAKA
jgi:glutathione S-transferase